VCAFHYGKAHGVYQRHRPPQEIGAMGHPKLLLPVRRKIGFCAWENLPAKLSPEGTAENSPARQCWVYAPGKTSPAGTTENVPGHRPGLAVPELRIIHFKGKDAQDCILGHSQPSLPQPPPPGVSRWRMSPLARRWLHFPGSSVTSSLLALMSHARPAAPSSPPCNP
jgi:hypothetical protein